jgi:hypothetical protein
MKKEHITEQEGIPQGGIDSPYLWNIYMMEFDNFVHKKTNEIFDQINKKIRGNKPAKRIVPPIERRRLDKYKAALRFLIRTLNRYPNQHVYLNSVFEDTQNRVKYGFKQILIKYKWQDIFKQNEDTNELKYSLMTELRQTTHKLFQLPASDPSKVHLRFIYCRYADDWILLNNAPQPLNEELKKIYKDFLWNDLKATLAEDKTLITDIRKDPAHFLGFEIRTPSNNKIIRYTKNKSSAQELLPTRTQTVKTSVGKYVYALPDRQRLINRLHMKGYCSKSGFPKEVRWLTDIEPYAIIERFNSVLRGFSNYYTEFIKSPNKQMSRWIYIIRYSCLKTLAQKYKTTIRGIFNRFGHKGKIIFQNKTLTTKEKTIEFTLQHTIDGIDYIKTWRLLTLQELIIAARNIKRYNTVADTFWALENGHITNYNITEGRIPAIKDDTYLDAIRWVNLRTQASLDLPCCICGSPEDIEMHHIKAIRKTRYELIPEDRPWQKVMALRNRKQIPVCRGCHMNIIHAGKYNGTKLTTMAPKILFDNRLVHIESYVKVGKEYFAQTLEEKGWKRKLVGILPELFGINEDDNSGD